MNYLEILEKFKIPIALSLVGLVLIIGGSILSLKKPTQKSFPKESLIQEQKSILVDVSGAVSNPGVYSLPEGSRVEDAIKAAGEILQEANQEYISKSLNLAQKISDGSKIYIPFEGEQGGVVAGVSGNSQTQININTSSQGELESLPGIGPVTASKIINGRPYSAIEELLNKKVVSKAVFEKISGQISSN